MILNPEKIIKKYKCKKHVGEYLIRKGLPVLSVDNDFYYFTDNEILHKYLENVPFIVRLLDMFGQ